MGLVHVQFRMEEEQLEAVKKVCGELGIGRSDGLRMAVAAWLDTVCPSEDLLAEPSLSLAQLIELAASRPVAKHGPGGTNCPLKGVTYAVVKHPEKPLLRAYFCDRCGTQL